MAVEFKPKGYHSVTPYLALRDAAKAIEFYKKAFGAVEKFRMAGPDGKIGHAEIMIGDSTLMMAEETAPLDFHSPAKLGGSAVMLHVYVPDVDAFVKNAVAAGAKLTRAVETQFYGDRGGSLVDPFGHMWYIATHVEDVPPEELESRAKAAKSGSGA